MPKTQPEQGTAEQQYQDFALVDIYDQLNPLGRDSDYFIAACAPISSSVLDLGCGTGLLAVTLATLGHQVLGVDPSAAMLRIAQQRSDMPNLSWRCGDARHLALDRRFDRVIATGHIFQVFLDEADQLGFLRTARRHLAEDGLLIFDTRNPRSEPWLRWTPAHSKRRIVHDLHGQIEIWHEATSATNDVVTFQSKYRFLDRNQEIVSTSTLAFSSVELLKARLTQAGLDLVTLHGDWAGGAVSDRSPEIIVTARPSHVRL
jgi:SAM-dependent methyltransferase